MRTKKAKELAAKRENGGYAPMAYVVLRSESFARLSAHAVKLLMDLCAQYKGDNNGDMSMAWTLMQKRGWRSRDTLSKARRELLDRDWIMMTRQGGRNRTTLYALTFFSIDPCKGKLDVSDTHSPPSTWRRHEPMSPELRAALNKSPSTLGVSKVQDWNGRRANKPKRRHY